MQTAINVAVCLLFGLAIVLAFGLVAAFVEEYWKDHRKGGG